MNKKQKNEWAKKRNESAKLVTRTPASKATKAKRKAQRKARKITRNSK